VLSFCAGIRLLAVDPGYRYRGTRATHALRPSAQAFACSPSIRGAACAVTRATRCVAPFCAGIRLLAVDPGYRYRGTRATHALRPSLGEGQCGDRQSATQASSQAGQPRGHGFRERPPPLCSPASLQVRKTVAI